MNNALLTGRENQVLAYAAQGLSDKQICLQLGVSQATVRTYWERVRNKLKAVNRVNAVCLAFGYVAPGSPVTRFNEYQS